MEDELQSALQGLNAKSPTLRLLRKALYLCSVPIARWQKLPSRMTQ